MLNVQVIVSGVLHDGEAPSWAKVVSIPARNGQGGEPGPCPRCAGGGRLPRGEECRLCRGTGTGRWLWAVRADPRGDDQLTEIAGWIDTRTDIVSVQTTLRLAEHGGGLTNTGSAVIVCGVHGEPLVSVHGRAVMGADHAVFFVFCALVVSYSHHRGEGSGSVTLYGVDSTAWHNLGHEEVTLWRFRDGDDAIEVVAPSRVRGLMFPFAAVAAAKAKASAYHCRSAYYVAAGGASGPSGALRGAGAAFGGMPSSLKGPGIGY